MAIKFIFQTELTKDSITLKIGKYPIGEDVGEGADVLIDVDKIIDTQSVIIDAENYMEFMAMVCGVGAMYQQKFGDIGLKIGEDGRIDFSPEGGDL